MVGWAGWPPATWTRWRLWKCLRSATASATSSEYLIRRSATAWQVEITDKWLQIRQSRGRSCDQKCILRQLGGHTEHCTDAQGRYLVRWIPEPGGSRESLTTPRFPATGRRVRALRLWKSEAAESFDFGAFNVGDYYGAVEEKVNQKTLSKVLYPNDERGEANNSGSSSSISLSRCSLQDMLRWSCDSTGRAARASSPDMFAIATE